MKTKLFTLLFALLLANGLFAEGTKIGNLYYNLDEDTRTAEVTYETEPQDYDYDNYASLSGAVVIPSSVIYNNIQYSVTSIGYNAFSGCTGLTSITIPESLRQCGMQDTDTVNNSSALVRKQSYKQASPVRGLACAVNASLYGIG